LKDLLLGARQTPSEGTSVDDGGESRAGHASRAEDEAFRRRFTVIGAGLLAGDGLGGLLTNLVALRGWTPPLVAPWA
jgi:uncharacterized oligopeptide transporter (OPT) family protein